MASVGGGISSCLGLVLRNTIQNNSALTATGEGGGMFNCLNIYKNIIRNNAGLSGGGMNFCQQIFNNTINGNTATQGGGLYNCYTMKFNVFYQNSASSSGGGGFHLVTDSGVRNNIYWGNTAPVDPQLTATAGPQYCIIQGWTGGGTGNLTSDPQFINAAAGNFHVSITSPCIDRGGTVPNYEPQDDLDGNGRPINYPGASGGDGSNYDIGLDEVLAPTAAADWERFE
jgi:hypothetical protein